MRFLRKKKSSTFITPDGESSTKSGKFLNIVQYRASKPVSNPKTYCRFKPFQKRDKNSRRVWKDRSWWWLSTADRVQHKYDTPYVKWLRFYSRKRQFPFWIWTNSSKKENLPEKTQTKTLFDPRQPRSQIRWIYNHKTDDRERHWLALTDSSDCCFIRSIDWLIDWWVQPTAQYNPSRKFCNVLFLHL